MLVLGVERGDVRVCPLVGPGDILLLCFLWGECHLLEFVDENALRGSGRLVRTLRPAHFIFDSMGY